MRSINGAVLRSAFAMVLGFVLVLWPEAAITYLVITIGILSVSYTHLTLPTIA